MCSGGQLHSAPRYISISISISIVTAVTGFAVCQCTQLEKRLWFQKIELWNPVSKVCCFRGASTPLTCKRKLNHNKSVSFDTKICAV